MSRRSKDELTKALKRSPEKMPDLSDDAKRLFWSLKTRWDFLAKMALEGRDICGPQTAHIIDGKMSAAEGADAHAL